MRFQGNNTYSAGEYTGEYRDGEMHGIGTTVWPSGFKYEDTFEHDWIWGTGKFTFPDGSVNEGEVEDGSMHGHGIYTWPDGSKHDFFANNLPNSKGKVEYADGRSYDGWWLNGSCYEGNWLDDKRNGYGNLIFPDGTVLRANLLTTSLWDVTNNFKI